MPNLASTTATFWSADAVALAAVRGRVAGASRHAVTPHDFSLEAAVPSGLDPERWDHERAVDLWGCGRPELASRLVVQGPDRLVYEIVTPYSGPDTVFAELSRQHPGVVVHSTTTCETEFASTAWFVRGEVVGAQEMGIELSDEELDAWDGEWPLPADWSFDAATARELLGPEPPVSP